MHLFIRRLLKFFKVYKVVYKGQSVSNNAFYAGAAGPSGWAVRAGIKNKYAKLYKILLLEAKIPKMQEYAVLLMYNSRQDVDNSGGNIKILLDVLKHGWVPEDDKRYCKACFQVYDPTLPHNTFEFHIIKLK